MSRGTLFVVATPLGHLGDLTLRAIEVLRGADIVAAEDTRRTRPLLAHLGAKPRRVVSCHAHTSKRKLEELAALAASGRSVALVTDAGTPTISDPGASLVAMARAAGAEIVVVPGPTAVAAALSVSGLSADRYTFLGFVPRAGGERKRLLRVIAGSEWTIVVFEAAPRLSRLLDDMRVAAGDDRQAAVAREMTKLHEEVRTGTLAELAVYYKEQTARGEVTIVVAGRQSGVAPVPEALDAVGVARDWLGSGMSRRDVASRLHVELGIPRKEAYRMVTAL